MARLNALSGAEFGLAYVDAQLRVQGQRRRNMAPILKMAMMVLYVDMPNGCGQT